MVKLMPNIQVVLCFIFLIPLSSANAGVDELNNRFENKNYQNMIQKYLPLAETGEASAQNEIAIVYMQGNGVIKDLDKAFVWFEKAAYQHHAEAQYYYAMFTLNGQSTQKSPEKAILWFKKAAQQGYVKAQSSLGILYMIGLGTKVDYPESFNWNKKAAEAGNAESMYNLAQLYEKGKGAELSSNKAVFWYEQSAKQGFTLSEFELGVAHALGLGGYEKNQNKAIEWYEKAAKKGNVYAQSNLAQIYLAKSNQDYKYRYQSVFWRKKIAEQGSVESQMLLGLAYLNGEGIERDKPLGLEWLYKSSQSGHEPAKKVLEELNRKQENNLALINAKYQKEAKTWTQKTILELKASAKNGDAMSQERLAIAYQFALLGAPKNTELAAEWYIKRIDSNLSDTNNTALKNLSLIYADGLNKSLLHQENETTKVKLKIDRLAANANLAAIKFLARFYNNYSDGYQSIKQARFWYAKVANMDDSGAQLALARLYMASSPNEAGNEAQPDYTKALYWYKKVALNDKPHAQYELAKLYIDGRGGEKNPREAMALLAKASDKNIFDAQMDLAKAYKEGVITKQDYPKALELFRSLATSTYSRYENRDITFYDTAMHVAEIYESGLGVPLDKSKAYVWYSLVNEYFQKTESSRPFSVGDFPLSSDYNPEEDMHRGFIMGADIDSSTNTKRLQNIKTKLNVLEGSMIAIEINKSKKALSDWKDSHPRKPINSI